MVDIFGKNLQDDSYHNIFDKRHIFHLKYYILNHKISIFRFIFVRYSLVIMTTWNLLQQFKNVYHHELYLFVCWHTNHLNWKIPISHYTLYNFLYFYLIMHMFYLIFFSICLLSPYHVPTDTVYIIKLSDYTIYICHQKIIF